MKLLDLFSGAGGAAMGYSRAGFDVTGVDIAPQPRYPFDFIQADALEYVAEYGHLYDAIHASPPCQAYSTLSSLHKGREYPDLYAVTRSALIAAETPWVIENVIGAPYRAGIILCGSMFGLRVRRHRNFESSLLMFPPACNHREQGTPLGIYGHGGGGQDARGWKAKPSEFGELMDMPWAKPREIVQAIPPAYAEYIGTQLAWHLDGKVSA